MQLTAEVRWFGLGSLTDDLKSWFLGPAHAFRYSAGGGHSRTDGYLLLKETELSIKKRGGERGFEGKGLVGAIPWAFQLGQVTVTPQLLCKWSSTDLEVANVPVVETVKVRWLRKFDTANDPCEIQLGAGDVGEELCGYKAIPAASRSACTPISALE